ncbi:MAG: rod shape-determining protein [Clostridia bacterium]|nr:rod shape-determining protein [Clostridia bacterium]
MLGLNIGIDLGTTSVIIYVEGKGIIMSEPSVVAFRTDTGRIMSVGSSAYDMIGRCPDSITAIRPMKDGVVSNFTVTEQMIRYYIQKICGNKIFKPNVIVCMPSGITNLEHRIILDVMTASGAGKACLIEEPLAAAIGAGVDISRPCGIMVVDIGGGTSDAAIITMGSIAISKTIKAAGNILNEDIMRYVRRERDVLIGELTAEQIKKTIGCAYLREEEIAMVAKGKNYLTGMPMSFEITSTETYLAMREHINSIIEMIKSVLEETPPELVGDLMQEGIILTGAGAKLYGLDIAIEEATKLKTRVAQDSENCVANGIGKVLKNLEFLADNGYLFKTRQDITGVEAENNSY